MSTPGPEEELDNVLKTLEEIDERLGIPLARPPKPPTPPGSSKQPASPHNDPMEARVAVIENRLDHIDKEVSQVKWWVAGSTLTSS